MAKMKMQFMSGKNLSNEVPFTAGTIYYDEVTHELWYDDPTTYASDKVHKKIIDTDTFLYTVEERIENFPIAKQET